MPKGRLLNRCISSSRRIESMTEWAQLLFDRLVIWSDDFGILEGDPYVVRATVKPLSDRPPADFASAIVEMIGIGAINAYCVGKRTYLHVDKHDDQQSGLHKRTKSHYPDPSSGTPLSGPEYLTAVRDDRFPEVPGNSPPEEKGNRKEEEEKTPCSPPQAGDATTPKPEEREGAPEKKARNRERFEIGPDFQPTPEDREWARASERMSDAEIDEQTGRFVRHHRAKGNRFKRPDLAWRNWISGRFVGAARPVLVPQIGAGPRVRLSVDDIRDLEVQLREPWTRADCTVGEARSYVAHVKALPSLDDAPTLAQWLTAMRKSA